MKKQTLEIEVCPECQGLSYNVEHGVCTNCEYESPDAPKAARTQNGRPKKEKSPPRIPWQWSPYPNVVVDDADLSGYAKLVALAITRRINTGPWNTDLHTDLTDLEIGRLASISPASAYRGRIELKQAGYIESESLGRGGNRIRFTETTWRNDG